MKSLIYNQRFYGRFWVFIYFCAYYIPVTSSEIVSVKINKCPEAYVKKNLPQKSFRLPGSVVSTRQSIDLEFMLRFNGCKSNDSFVTTLSFFNNNEDDENATTTVPTFDINEVKPSSLEDGIPDWITPKGMLSINSEYYYPEEYCILSATESYIQLQVCKVQCGSSMNPCVPKCCDLDEVLEIDSNNVTFSCQHVRNSEQTWHPYFYAYHPHEPLSSQANAVIRPHYQIVPMGSGWLRKLPLLDLKEIQPTWPRELWRIYLDGTLHYLNDDRSWYSFPKVSSCVDGLQNVFGQGPYERTEANQILLAKLQDYQIDDPNSSYPTKSCWYLVLAFIAATFYGALTIVYSNKSLRKENDNQRSTTRKIHLTILSYVLSLFIMSLLNGIIHSLTCANEATLNTDNNATTSTSVFQLGNTETVVLAVALHYFILSSFCWITIMSFDLLLIFRSVKPRSSDISSETKKYAFYSLVGWGAPLSAVLLFVFFDHHFANYETEFKIPAYGQYNYFIAPWAQGLYLYYIVAVILTINLMFACMTAVSIAKLRRSRDMLNSGLSTKNRDYLSFKLFFKLFIIMGVLWIFELISFLHAGQNNPWYWVITDVLQCLQSIALFVIFVFNEKSFNYIREALTLFSVRLRGSMINALSIRRKSQEAYTDSTRASF